MIFRVLRGLAVLIAIAGAIDPSITSMRRASPTVAVVSSDAAMDAALTDRVARELAADFTIVRGPFAGAAAIVSVGDRLPPNTDTFPSSLPAFAVTAATDAPRVRITAVRAPARTNLESRTSIETVVRTEGSRGRTLDLVLEHDGVAIDRVTRPIGSDEETIAATLAFAPTAEGATPLAIRASVGDSRTSATADLLVDVSRARWAVLAFDRRPSWMSTFVRRALEADPRFVVTSRVMTSRDLSTDTGRPPNSFEDLPSLSLFDAVIVGAPEDLTERDIQGLETFLRRRGGAVCLLLDQRAPGAYERLIGAPKWATASTNVPVTIDGTGVNPSRLLATEIAWPSILPPGAMTIASSATAAGDTTARPVIWSVPAGAGRVIASGALDTWRYRDVAPASFDRFWRGVIAESAAAAPPLVNVDVAEPLLAPGELTTAGITLRDAALADNTTGRASSATVRASIETPAGAVTLRAWPTGTPGELRVAVRAPDTPGMYRLSVTGSGTRVDTPIVVQPNVTRARPDERDLVAAWTASRGGITVPAARSREVGQALRRALSADSRLTTWHPMRSAWWILPFALALGAEWFWRRIHGRA